MPAVSVIIPTYNRANVLARAIQSVIAQDYPDFELVIVDDGSTDETQAVVESFHDSRIRYLYQQNQERSAARNTGIGMSRGKYLSFLDSDDEYLPNKLSDQVKIIEQIGSGMVMSGWQEADQHGCIIHTGAPWISHPSPVYSLDEWLISMTGSFCASLVERRWVEEAGGFDPDLNSSEDVDLWFRIAKAGCTMNWARCVALRVYPKLADPSVYLKNYLFLLEKAYRSDSMDKPLKLDKSSAQAILYLNVAAQAYQNGSAEDARKYLQDAISLDPNLRMTSNGSVLESLISRCWRVATPDPVAYMKFVMDHLPDEFFHLQQQRKWAMGRAWRASAYRARSCNYGKGGVAAGLKAIWLDPSLSFNRGLASVIIRCATAGKW